MLLKLSSAMLLVTACAGLWLIKYTAKAPRLVARRVYRLARQRLRAMGDPGGDLGGPEATRLPAGRGQLLAADRSPAALGAAGRALQASRGHGRHLVVALTADAATLAQTVGDIRRASARLADDAAALQTEAALADGTMSAITAGALSLAQAARATTEQARQATAIAVRLAQIAFQTRNTIAGLDDDTACMAVAADDMAQSLRRIGALTRRGGLDATGHGTADIDEEVRTLAAAALAGLDQMRGATTALHIEAASAHHRLADLGAVIAAQHDMGLAVCQAVMQQIEDIAGVLAQLTAARSGLATVRAGVDAVSRTGIENAARAEWLLDTAERLPGHIETVAAILRGIPDFAPPADD